MCAEKCKGNTPLGDLEKVVFIIKLDLTLSASKSQQYWILSTRSASFTNIKMENVDHIWFQIHEDLGHCLDCTKS